MFTGRVRSMQPVDKRLLYGCDKRRSIYFNGLHIRRPSAKNNSPHVLPVMRQAASRKKCQSCRLAEITVERSAETSARSHSSRSRSNWFAGNDESVVQSLMVSLHMIMGNEMSNGVPERIFTKENHLLETTFFNGPHESFRVGVQ